MYICVYICIYVCICMYVYTSMYMYMCICTYVYMYIYVYTYLFAYIYMYMFMYIWHAYCMTSVQTQFKQCMSVMAPPRRCPVARRGRHQAGRCGCTKWESPKITSSCIQLSSSLRSILYEHFEKDPIRAL